MTRCDKLLLGYAVSQRAPLRKCITIYDVTTPTCNGYGTTDIPGRWCICTDLQRRSFTSKEIQATLTNERCSETACRSHCRCLGHVDVGTTGASSVRLAGHRVCLLCK